MAKVVKKKKKKLGGRSTGGSTSGKKVTPLRPYRNPQTPPCQHACPMGNDIRGALTYVAQSEKYERSYEDALDKAWTVFTETNPMPSVLGRVCPHPCEDKCNRLDKDGALNINQFERTLGDHGLERGLRLSKLTDEKTGKKIAVVGSGPAGVSCAYQLCRRGHDVTMFEAFPKPGGMVRYGIPPYRLPREIIDKEIQRVVDLGVELKCNTVVGKDVPLEELQREYDAVYIGIGCHEGRKLGAPGEDASNILTGAEFLHRINSGETIDVGNDVVVVGGGDSAIDAARVCKRLGANTTIVYRRTKAEMPAISHEIEEAEREGIGFEFLSVPIEAVLEGDRAVKLICQRMELGEPDSSGRRRPVPIEGDTYERSVSTLIPAISQQPEFVGDLEKAGNAKSWLRLDDRFTHKDLDRVYGGGDAYNLGLVTIAVGQGHTAAKIIDGDLRGEKWEPAAELQIATKDKIKPEFYAGAARYEQESLPVDERFKGNGESLYLEVNKGLTQEQAIEESKRCFSCGMCFDCDNCWMYCQDQAVDKAPKDAPIGEHYIYIHDKCTGCEKCAEECPCGYLQMR